MGFQKPNNLHYPNLLNSHSCDYLSENDSTIFCSLVKLTHLMEKIASFHENKQPTGDSHIEALNAEMSVQIFGNELRDWRAGVTEEVMSLRKFSSSSYC